ncbi:MAG: universal stress protein [Bacteroidia bacterium]
MKTILAATDFSKASLNAIDYAAEIAALLNVKLILLHVYHVPMVTSEVPMMIPSLDEIEAEGMDELVKIEKELKEKFPSLQTELKCVCGFALEEIERLNAALNLDIVIMGMRGTGMLEEKLVGSVTTSLIKRGKCVVLSIEEHVKFRTPKKIVLATDYSKIKNKQIFDPLKSISETFNSQVYILNVVKDKTAVPEISEAAEGIRLDHILERTDHSYFNTENKNITEGINQFVTSHNMDMVVMIPGQHNVLESLVKEGNTKQMAYHSLVPLLTLQKD